MANPNLITGLPPLADSSRRRYRSLEEILRDPSALSPPVSIMPRLVWRERVTCLAAREKNGKSTLAQAGASAVSKGRRFLDETAALNRVLFLALEEHTADVATKFVDFKCDPSRIYIMDRLETSPFEELVEAVAELTPAVVIVDTLAEFTKAMGLEGGSSKDWQPVMSQFTRIARDMDTGILLLHHARKSDGKYRDSSAIGAGVDVLIEMHLGSETSIRKMEVRSRWAIGNFDVRLAGDPDDDTNPRRFELADGEPSLDARIILHIRNNPGCALRSLRHGVSGRAKEIDTALRRLIRYGEIENRGTEIAFRLHLAAGSVSGTGHGACPSDTLADKGRTRGRDTPKSCPQTLGHGNRDTVEEQAPATLTNEEPPWA